MPADVSWKLEPYSCVCFAFARPVNFTSCSTSNTQSIFCCLFCVSNRISLPLQRPCVCASRSNLHVPSLLGQPLRALAANLLFTLKMHACLSMPSRISLSITHSSFSSHHQRHVSFKFVFLLFGDTMTSYLGHVVPESPSCNLTELADPVHCFQLTLLINV